jgi:hypothetical protein
MTDMQSCLQHCVTFSLERSCPACLLEEEKRQLVLLNRKLLDDNALQRTVHAQELAAVQKQLRAMTCMATNNHSTLRNIQWTLKYLHDLKTQLDELPETLLDLGAPSESDE